MNILFIDDDPEDIEMYQDVIRYLNDSEYLAQANEKLMCYTHTRCNDIIQIITELGAKPDLIFLDINMPIVGGKECLLTLKAHPEYSRVPVIMLSTACSKEEEKMFKTIGAFECIKKPNDFKVLIKIFSKFVFQTL